MTEIENSKLEKLKKFFIESGSAAIAFSGGVDSTFLAKVAHQVLGDKMIAITLVANSFPKRERNDAIDFCKKEGIPQLEIEYDELSVPGFKENPVDRCYLCKKELFKMVKSAAKERGISVVCEGSNMDDTGDYRPGLRAIKEMGVKSPLQYAELTKQEIRNLSKEYNLPTWDKPSLACLATRFVYGETITKEKLIMVGKAEQLLVDLGFRQMRVRLHGTMARIELLPEDFAKFMQEEIRTKVAEEFKSYGFSYVTLDIQGFRSGSMNYLLK
ncbi:MAG: ATP-dependent sacrificial sulfur transferase LarE [Treponema sp.]|nr:ATP-dependent sacrificial sulfur transferase LarE [Treponema sp.]